MEKERFYCLYCGHWLESRVNTPEERQCSYCRRRKGLISEEEFRRGVEVTKSILRTKKPKVPFLQAAEDVADILSQTFPNPFIPGRTLIHIIRKAQEEIKIKERGKDG